MAKRYKSEAEYQGDLKKIISEKILPGSIVLKNDPTILQGIPDLTVIYKDKSALLEVKMAEDSAHQPNQDYYISYANNMGGFGRFIYPENEKEILDELQEFMKK